MKIFAVIVTKVTYPKGSKSFVIVDKMARFVLGKNLGSET